MNRLHVHALTGTNNARSEMTRQDSPAQRQPVARMTNTAIPSPQR